MATHWPEATEGTGQVRFKFNDAGAWPLAKETSYTYYTKLVTVLFKE
jgi:hypothetical protein